MSDEYISCAVDQHQQQGGMPLKDFAVLEGLTKSQALQLVKRGHVLGAQRTHGGRWLVFPPAKLLYRPRRYNRETSRYDSLQTDVVAAASAFDVGTRPHGLSADAAGTHQETSGQAAPLFLADQQAEGAQAFGSWFQLVACLPEANGIAGAAAADPNAEASNCDRPGVAAPGAVTLSVVPDAFRSPQVQSTCRHLQTIAAACSMKHYHYLELTECELLLLLVVVECGRKSIRKAVAKGSMSSDVLMGSTSLWKKLREVQAIQKAVQS